MNLTTLLTLEKIPEVEICQICEFWLWQFLNLSYIAWVHNWTHDEMCTGLLFVNPACRLYICLCRNTVFSNKCIACVYQNANKLVERNICSFWLIKSSYLVTSLVKNYTSLLLIFQFHILKLNTSGRPMPLTLLLLGCLTVQCTVASVSRRQSRKIYRISYKIILKKIKALTRGQ